MKCYSDVGLSFVVVRYKLVSGFDFESFETDDGKVSPNFWNAKPFFEAKFIGNEVMLNVRDIAHFSDQRIRRYRDGIYVEARSCLYWYYGDYNAAPITP